MEGLGESDRLVARVPLRERLATAAETPSGEGAVVLVGAPGMGKTSLLADVGEVAGVSGSRVLQVSGSEAESALPYAALHLLLTPLLSQLPTLPPLLASALAGAFGTGDGEFEGSVQTTFHISLAVLHLLAESGGSRSTVVLVDDAQWVDRDTLAVLGFVARRTVDRPVLIVAASRPGAMLPFENGTEFTLGPLSRSEAVELLNRRRSELGDDARRRVLDIAAGNPLALVELSSTLTDVAGGMTSAPPWSAAPIPLTRRLERAFAQHYQRLAPGPGTALLAAALNSSSAASEALEAASAVLGHSVTPEDLDVVVAEGLVVLDANHIRFRHPLVRSGVVQEAPEPTTRAVHRALATVLTEDPDRRAWHMAQVVILDGAVAADLEAAADRADRRGGPETAIALLIRAAMISPRPREQQIRHTRAAELSMQLGHINEARRLLASVTDDIVPWAPALRATLDEHGYYTAARVTDIDFEQIESFLRPARQASQHGRTDLALRVLQPLANSPHAELARRAIEEARRLFEVSPTPGAVSIVAAVPALTARAVEIVHRELRRGDLDAETRRLYLTAATIAFDYNTAVDHLPDVVSILLSEGRRVAAGQAMCSLSTSLLLVGRLEEAERVALEATSVCRETHQEFWTPGALIVLAWRNGLTAGLTGLEARIAEALAETRAGAVAPLHRTLELSARCAGALAGSHYAEAADRGRELFELGFWARWWGVSDYVEAAVRAGRPGEVREPVEELGHLAGATMSPWLLARHAFCGALLADDAAADPAYAAAITRCDPSDGYLRGRVRLAYAVWLRRQRRVREARVYLEQARGDFRRAGPTLWDHAVDRELQASGAAGRAEASSGTLTPQERQVALLVAQGFTNREVAEKLLVAPRTVSTHLQRVFSKLNVSDRRQLAHLPLSDDERR